MTTKFLIGALSCQGEPERKEMCRATWMATARERGVPAYLLIGCQDLPAAEVHDDELWLPCQDSYRALPQKTHAFCQWAIGQDGWDYLLKCDSDTYVAVDRLLAYDCRGADYLGSPWRDRVHYASGGAGYLLSRKAAEVVAKGMTQKTGPEDMIVADVLRRSKIILTEDREAFIPWGNDDRRPRPGNRAITTHKVGRHVFEACHADMRLS